jgi:hypothetical protein
MTGAEYWSNDGDSQFTSEYPETIELLSDIEGYFNSRKPEKYLAKKYPSPDRLSLQDRLATKFLIGAVTLFSIYSMDQVVIVGLSAAAQHMP